MEKNWFATLVKRLKRLLTIYVFWALFYLYFGIRQVLSDNSSSWYVVVIKSVFVSPPGWGPGWYILSSIASLLMISILISSGCERCALILSIVLFVFFVGLSGYNEFLPFPHGVVTLNQEFTPYTSIFAGFPWVYLGYFVRKYNLNSLSKKFQIIGLIVSMTFFIFENKLIDTFSLGTTHAFTLSLLPLSVFIFVLLTDTNNLRLEWVDSKKLLT